VECELRTRFWIAHRMIIKRMPSSIKEKAQKSIDPKATGVKIIRKMRVYLLVDPIL
jgi:hypothetical protein